MSGWSQRRSSGEILNATLLEIFLLLAFMVFALAVFHQRRANAAEAALTVAQTTRPDPEAAARTAAALAATQDSLRTVRQVAAGRADSLARAMATIDSLRSPYPPDCEAGVVPQPVLTATILNPTDVRITAHAARFGLAVGESVTLPLAQVPARFAEASRYGRANRCRYKVLVRDTDGTTKASFKAALGVLNVPFRLTGAW